MTDLSNIRTILYHKQNSSARTRFVQHPYGGVLGFDGAPKSYHLMEGKINHLNEQTKASITNCLSYVYRLEADDIQIEDEFDAVIGNPDTELSVMLVRLNTVDPPFENVEETGARFIPITEARGMPEVELELLQRAYQNIMEG